MIDQENIQGHWIREWIKAPGFEDHTTHVHWMQVGLEYADVRIPSARPDISSAAALSDLSADALAQLAKAEGFAGHVTLAGDTCTWHREINWHGTPDVADVGSIRFAEDGRMIETGVHADYTELWQHNSGISGLIRCSGDGYLGLCATVGEHCVVGIGAVDMPPTKELVQALEERRIPVGIDRLFDGLHALGHRRGSKVIADRATNPFAEQQPVLTVSESVVIWHRRAFDGQLSDVILQIDSVL